MGPIITDFKEMFKRGEIHIRLIVINVAIFVLTTFLEVVMNLFNGSLASFFEWLALPASLTRFLHQPWALFTYMFMHAGFMHILFNMLWLYWFGMLFLQVFSSKHLRGVYLLGGVCGGLLYMVAYNVFPYFQPAVGYSTLVGASAGVLAVVAAVAYREPNYPIRLFLLGTVRLKYLALFVVLTDLLMISGSNAGGHIAHLGGALAGLCFAAGLARGVDVTVWINGLIDGLVTLFERIFRPKPKMKVKYGRGGARQQDYDYNAHKKAQSEAVDRILEKLKKSGYNSLSTEEKKQLFDASKR